MGMTFLRLVGSRLSVCFQGKILYDEITPEHGKKALISIPIHGNLIQGHKKGVYVRDVLNLLLTSMVMTTICWGGGGIGGRGG